MKRIFLCLSILVIQLATTSCLPIHSDDKKDSFSTTPILRIETGMHTAMIRRIATDSKKKILATASDDKTVRIWEITRKSSPALLRVIRPPIGEGNEGKLNAVALDPEGKILVTGGWTGYEWDKKISLYFFDVATGNLLYSISGLEDVILHLAFSSDGKFLVATLGTGAGIRVYQEKKGQFILFAEDPDYGADSYWGEFHGNLLATTCWDGSIRIYTMDEKGEGLKDKEGSKTLHPYSKVQTKSGKEPYGLAFSQDGKNLSMGYNDSTGIDIYTIGKSKMEYSFSPDTSALTNGNLVSVTYSGDSLYAGGRYGKTDDISSILKFPKAGKGKSTEISVSKNTIMHILPDGKGGVFFGGGGPLFGQLDSNGKLLFTKASEIADYRNMRTAMKLEFLVSENNQSIVFLFDYEGKQKAFFSLADRMIISDTSAVETLRTTSLRAPILTHDKIKIENWYNQVNPTCNGNPIFLRQYEISRSLSIGKDGSRFVLGADWSLRYFDSTCKQIWENPVPGFVWAVNLSADGSYVLAAFSDGTIRYYNTKDGKELAAFFPHANKTDWVFWTPEGYFDSSPNGEKLIGFHVNQGKNKEGLFFTASRFFDAYYRPDVIAEVIKSGEPATQAVARLDGVDMDKVGNLTKGFALPPVVKILSPLPHQKIESSEVEVVVKVTDRGGEFRNVTLFQNEKEQKYKEEDILIKNELISKSRILTYKLSLNAGENRIKATAFSDKMIETDFPPVLQINTTPKKGKLYALVLGVRYPEKSLKLNFTANDSDDIEKIFQSQKKKLKQEFDDVEITVLPPDRQKQKDIFHAFKEISAKTKKEDLFVFYYSGHGAQIEEEAKDKSTPKKKMFYLIPSDITDLASVKAKGVSLRQIGIWLQKMPALRQVLFLDACHSGDVVDHFGEDKEFRILSKQGPLVFAASTSSQVANELSKLQHGIFTYALLQALKGDADIDKDGLSLKDIEYYLHRFIPKLSRENGIEKQIPSYQNVSAERDFILIPADK